MFELMKDEAQELYAYTIASANANTHTSENTHTHIRKLASLALALLANYMSVGVGAAGRLVRIEHVNSVLRMLYVAQMHAESGAFFRFLVRFVHRAAPEGGGGGGSSWLFPSTFTIAELVRIGCASNNHSLVSDALIWGAGGAPANATAASRGSVGDDGGKDSRASVIRLQQQQRQQQQVFLPVGLIGAGLSFLYALGRTDLVTHTYTHLYTQGAVDHWVDAGHEEEKDKRGGGALRIMDLHGFNRGMAFAAVTCAISEVLREAQVQTTTRREVARKESTEGEENADLRLVVITGKGETRWRQRAGEEEAAQADTELEMEMEVEDGQGGTYVLLDTLQRMLVEEFLPPISSSTAKDNTGRLEIDLTSYARAHKRK